MHWIATQHRAAKPKIIHECQLSQRMLALTRVIGTLALASVVAANDNVVRSHNFGAGPAALPDEVLHRARDEFLNFKGTGL